MPRTLGVDDLKRVFIRAQDSNGDWGSFSVDEVSSAQFDRWARSRTDQIVETDAQAETWTLEERADFCNWLRQAGALHILKDEAEEPTQ